MSWGSPIISRHGVFNINLRYKKELGTEALEQTKVVQLTPCHYRL